MTSRGIYYGDKDWFRENSFTWFPDTPFKSSTWSFTESNKQFNLKLLSILAEKVRQAPESGLEAGEATAVFVARMSSCDGYTADVVVKIFLRIPAVSAKKGRRYVDKEDLLSQKLPIVAEECFGSRAFEREAAALKHATTVHCAHTPRYIASFDKQEQNPWAKDGFLGFVVMERLKAIPLPDIWEYEPCSQAQKEQQLRIQDAFKEAYVNTASIGLCMGGDMSSRNLMWDKHNAKIYFVDFEETWLTESKTGPNTWEDATRFLPSEELMFKWWGISMREQDVRIWEIVHPKD